MPAVNIEPEVYEDFRKYVFLKESKLRGSLQDTATAALKAYMTANPLQRKNAQPQA